MTTKAQVIRKAKNIGADFFENNEYGEYVVEVILPSNKMFVDYNASVCVQTRMPNEKMSDFWSDVLSFISCPVVEV
jgi:hypothetical protein